MHSAGWYLDFRIVFPPSFENEIRIGFTMMIGLDKKLPAKGSRVLKNIAVEDLAYNCGSDVKVSNP